MSTCTGSGCASAFLFFLDRLASAVSALAVSKSASRSSMRCSSPRMYVTVRSRTYNQPAQIMRLTSSLNSPAEAPERPGTMILSSPRAAFIFSLRLFSINEWFAFLSCSLDKVLPPDDLPAAFGAGPAAGEYEESCSSVEGEGEAECEWTWRLRLTGRDDIAVDFCSEYQRR